MNADALYLALVEFVRAYSDLRRHFHARGGHRLCAECAEAAARYRATQAAVADLGAAVASCGKLGCERVLVVRAGGEPRLAAFADRRGWALRWAMALCPDHRRPTPPTSAASGPPSPPAPTPALTAAPGT